MTNNEQNYTELILSKIPQINEDLDFEIINGVVVVYSAQDHLVQKILRKLGAKIPDKTSMTLDEYSTTVFMNINGKNSIYDIGVILEEEYGEEVKPVYERLLVLVEHFVYQRKWAHYIEKNDL